MSRETLQHLNTNVLIGNTDARGHAWHYKASEQGAEPNHYAGAIPVADVNRRLFGWQVESRPIAVEVPASIDDMTHMSDDGLPLKWQVIDGKRAQTRNDSWNVLGIFSDTYAGHQYSEWLVSQVSSILGDTLGISSAGLLKGGAIAWVEVSVPDTIVTPEGVAFRPNLLATTSFDGSIATTYKRTVTDTVCDNTRECALSERGQQYKVKHSRYSQVKLTEARDALAMIHTLADEFTAEVKALCELDVTDAQWREFLSVTVPMVDEKGTPLTGRAETMAGNKRAALNKLYRYDVRCSPWTGTAHGVIQAVNTYEHHEGIVRGATRQERNMLRTVTGDFGNVDRDAWAALAGVLQVA